MNKKTLSRITAASLAAMSAVSVMSVTASAVEVSSNNVVSGNVYKYTATTTDSNGVPKETTTYYISSDACKTATGSDGTAVNVNSAFGYGQTVYVLDGVVSTNYNASATKLTTSGSSTGTSSGSSAAYVAYNYASNTDNVYLGTNGKWYPNYSSLTAAGTTLANTYPLPAGQRYSDIKSADIDGYVYFDTRTGYYVYSPNADTVYIYGYSTSYDTYYYDRYYYYDTYDVYKVGSTYYPTLSSALSAAGNDYSKLTKIYDYSAPQTNYFSKTTGKYYYTYEAALAASGNSSSNVYTFSYYSGSSSSSSYYDGVDPYYYYFWLNKYGNTSDSSSSKTTDSTTATVGSKKGWTNVAKYLGNLKSGSSVSVSMNEETSVPSSVMSAIKGKDVTVKFVLDNGVIFTINGKDITTAKEFDIDTAYNTDNVPSSLVKKAYQKNDAVSAAQISIDDNSFGAAADITVKFATKRSGCTAKLYRYNASKSTLSLVDTAKVQSTGKCTFDGVTKGGDFVIVLC